MVAIASLLAFALISSRIVWRRKDRSLYLFLSILAITVMFIRVEPHSESSSEDKIVTVISTPRPHGRYRLSFRGRVDTDRERRELVTVILDGPRQFYIPVAAKLRVQAPVTRLGESLVVIRARWSQCQESLDDSHGSGQRAWQDWLGESLHSLPEPSKGLLKSALLGQKTELDRSTKKLFRRVGTAHLLAVSGLHVTLISGVIFVAFRLTGARYRLQLMAALLATWLYVTLVGFRPATIRAATLLSCYLLSRLLGLRRDPWNLLCFAASLLLIYRWDSLFDVGAQLSFASFSGLVFASSQISQNPASPSNFGESCLEFLGKSWVFTTWAFLSSTPFVLYHFGAVEPTALLSNLPAVPLFSVFLALGLLGTLLSAVHPLFGAPLLKLASILASLLIQMLRAFDGLLPQLTMNDFHQSMIFVPPIIALSSFFFWKRQRWRCVLTFLIALLTLLASIPKPERQVLELVNGQRRAPGKQKVTHAPTVLRFDRSRVSLLVGQQEHLIRFDTIKAEQGQWRLGQLIITKLRGKLWRFQRGQWSVLWIKDRPDAAHPLSAQDISSTNGLIVGKWLPRRIAQRLSKHWKGEWVLYQGLFNLDLETRRVMREENFDLEFGDDLLVRGLKKQ